MTTEPVTARECAVCPPWVERCAHFDGALVALVSNVKHLAAERCPIEGACRLGQEFQVLSGIDSFEPCQRCGVVLKGTGDATFLMDFDTLAEAEAYFAEAEEQLLAGADL